jgi:hypothetical protein
VDPSPAGCITLFQAFRAASEADVARISAVMAHHIQIKLVSGWIDPYFQINKAKLHLKGGR